MIWEAQFQPTLPLASSSCCVICISAAFHNNSLNGSIYTRNEDPNQIVRHIIADCRYIAECT